MIKTAISTTLSAFLDPENNTRYKIPHYQREYAWTKVECEELYNDIIENSPGYFLGSLIWVDNLCEVIDGQQRLTSLSLLLMAIYEKLPTSFEDDELITDKINLKRLLVNKDGSAKLELQKQHYNKDDYDYLISTKIVKKGQTKAKPKNFGNRRIGLNYIRFVELIQDLNTQELFDLYHKLSSIVFVSISVFDYQSAFQLFEAMNNRGIPLSPLDLIKNKYISKTNDIKNWEDLLKLLGDDYYIQEQFLRNNYNAFRAEYNNVDFTNNINTIKYEISNKAVRSNIIKIYEKLVDTKSDFMEVLLLRARIYSLFIGNEDSDVECDIEIAKLFKNFRNAKATSAYMLLLYIYAYKDEFCFTDQNLIDIFELVLKFFIRRNLTNIPSTGSIPQLLMNIIENINKLVVKNYDNIYQVVYNHFVNKSSTNEYLKSVLSGDLYSINVDMTRYLLCSLEEKDSNFNTTEREFKDLWEIKSNKYVWTIEHIFPEGKNIPKHWVDMIADGDKQLANQYRDEYVHTIGNLTMTGYNSSLSNMSFEKKKNRKDDNGNPIGYNNGLSLNEYVFKQDKWTINNIIERGEFLIEKIMDMLMF